MEIKQLNLALKIAQKAHVGQLDKGGKPYINHPIAVSKMVNSEEEKIVALLHDTVEDSEITIKDIKQYGFSDNVVDAITSMTKRTGETYDEYIKRLSQNNLAIKVKLADLKHNSDISRIPEPTSRDYARVEKYKKIILKLKS